MKLLLASVLLLALIAAMAKADEKTASSQPAGGRPEHGADRPGTVVHHPHNPPRAEETRAEARCSHREIMDCHDVIVSCSRACLDTVGQPNKCFDCVKDNYPFCCACLKSLFPSVSLPPCDRLQ